MRNPQYWANLQQEQEVSATTPQQEQEVSPTTPQQEANQPPHNSGQQTNQQAITEQNTPANATLVPVPSNQNSGVSGK
jgi:hypothetical protein